MKAIDHSNSAVELVDSQGKPVISGNVYKDFRGDAHRITGVRAPHKASSGGFVIVEDAYGNTIEYFVTVFNFKWRYL